MTVDATTPSRLGTGPGDRPGSPPGPGPHGGGRGRSLGIGAGQIVAVQVAAVLVAAAAGQRPLTLAAAVLAAAGLAGSALARVRGRWAYEWVAVALSYAGRRHTLPPAAEPAALLAALSPGARVLPTQLAGDPAAVISDGYGLTAVVELGDPGALVADALPALPSPAALLPAPGPQSPPTRVQLLLTGGPAPALRAGSGPPATSHRQLTGGRLLGHARALLVVRVQRVEGWSDAELHRALSGLVRKLPRRSGGVPVRPLGEAAVLRVLADLAHHDPAQPARETWSALHLGGLMQATFRLRRWPDLQVATARRLVVRLLALPATATTVAVTAGPWQPGRPPAAAVELTVRLAAPSAPALTVAAQALRRLVVGAGGDARRLDGAQLPGLVATLPLGGDPGGPSPVRPRGWPAAPAHLDRLDLSVAAAGLMLGSNRHGAPVVARLFRPEHSRVLLVGAVGTAQLVALRAMGLGARVVVQTARPQLWEPFVRAVSVPGESIALVPAGRVLDLPGGSALHPLLVVVDVGPVAAEPGAGGGWQATLVLRDDFGPTDVDLAARADLLILQRLQPEQADLVGSALGLSEAASWLARIRPDMVGVINRRSVRWALLAPTPIESQLTGAGAHGGVGAAGPPSSPWSATAP